ncbi:MAG TPA: glutaredoxin family protein [Synechococcales cyanobacterium M55_K2018_004]|nr:glutaredoxin family protein [Synechococcales cyanobacterium M55_K2018_004]
MHLILYSKPGCHLCEGLLEKLQQITTLQFDLEVRDITTQQEWFQAYQYEIPVLVLVRSSRDDRAIAPEFAAARLEQVRLPRLSPRASVAQVEAMLKQYFSSSAPPLPAD